MVLATHAPRFLELPLETVEYLSWSTEIRMGLRVRLALLARSGKRLNEPDMRLVLPGQTFFYSHARS